ncbi:hypothetical protein BT96DRAFT_1016074 [Gymnopus androsaceus JB14]|uniref:ABC transmembrane type-1 domain-containing protein n=1 Tax=Gymnopus androsaceus JB14 TaxID=1447944 RepID=A0A6A4I5K0_9AGAR|nr:hypothetical protein BT96DRAFT_1016074 [Gymnopus androsaceus JB14]
MTTWLLPWISLIAQLPFEADGWLNILSGCLAVGSPALAAYSIALTAYNRWYISREFQRLKVMAQRDIDSKYEYMVKRIDAAAFILQEVQQCSMRANQSNGQLGSLISMKDHHTDKFWEITKKDLSNTRRGFTYSFLAQVLLAFLAYLITFIAAVHDSLGSPDVGLQFATSTVWSWMYVLADSEIVTENLSFNLRFPIVFGYIRVGTQYRAGSIDEALTDNKLLPDGTGGLSYQTGLCANADLQTPQIPSPNASDPPAHSNAASSTLNPPAPSSAASNTLHTPVATPTLVVEHDNASATSRTRFAHDKDILLSTFRTNEDVNQALPDGASATASQIKFASQLGESRENDPLLNPHASTSQIFPHRSLQQSPLESHPGGNTAEGSPYDTRISLPLEDDHGCHEQVVLLRKVQTTPEEAIPLLPTWLGRDVRGDERREGPIFNYARIFTWFACAEHVQGGFRASLENFKGNAAIPSSSEEAAKICGFEAREDLKAVYGVGSCDSCPYPLSYNTSLERLSWHYLSSGEPLGLQSSSPTLRQQLVSVVGQELP